MSFDIKFTRLGYENACWIARQASRCQQAFSKSCLVNLISKDTHLLFCQPRVEVTSCFVYKVMGLTFHDRINTQLIYRFELAQVVAWRITKPQRFFRFESRWLLFYFYFFWGGCLILLFSSCLIFYLLFRVHFRIYSSLCCYRCLIRVKGIKKIIKQINKKKNKT